MSVADGFWMLLIALAVIGFFASLHEIATCRRIEAQLRRMAERR